MTLRKATKVTKATEATKAWQEKALILRVLSVGFLYPDSVWKQRFGTLLEKTIEALECAEGSTCGCGLRGLQTLLVKESFETLEEEHVRLFGSAGMAPLGFVFYLANNPFEQAKIGADLAGYFKAFGVEVKEGTRPDDLSACLEMAGYLWIKVIHAQKKGWKEREGIARRAARSLFQEFLYPGLKVFEQRLAKYAQSQFYPELTKIAVGVIKDE